MALHSVQVKIYCFSIALMQSDWGWAAYESGREEAGRANKKEQASDRNLGLSGSTSHHASTPVHARLQGMPILHITTRLASPLLIYWKHPLQKHHGLPYSQQHVDS